MEKAVRSLSQILRLAPNPGLIVVLGLGLAACSRPAADVPSASEAAIPPALSTAEQAMSCADIDRDLERTAAARGEIEGDADSTQKVGMGVYTAIPVVGALIMASESNEARKDELARIQAQRDRLIAVRSAKLCPAAAVDPATGRIRTEKR